MKSLSISKRLMPFITIALTLVLMVFISMEVSAANAKPTELKQTGAYANKATISWKAPAGAGSGYNYFFVQMSTDGKKWVDKTNVASNATTLTLTGLNRGTAYYLKIKAAFYSEATKKITIDGEWSDAIEVATMPGSLGKITQTKATKTAMTFTWPEAAGANCYDVYFGTSYSKLNFQARITGRTATIKGRKQGSVGYVKVVPVRLTAQKYAALGLDTYATIKTTQKPVKLAKENEWLKGKKTIHFTWTSPNKMTDGYRVRIYDGSKLKATVTTKNKYYFYRKASKNTYYKIKVDPYINVNGKKVYGTAVTGFALQPTSITGVAQDDGKVTITWNPVKGTGGYDVYAGYYPDVDSMALVASVGKNVTQLSTTTIGGTTVLSNRRIYYCVKQREQQAG